jgi:hypothetical protein
MVSRAAEFDGTHEGVPVLLSRLAGYRYVVEATALVDGEPAIFGYAVDPAGVRVEVVDRTIIPDFAEYLRTRAAA